MFEVTQIKKKLGALKLKKIPQKDGLRIKAASMASHIIQTGKPKKAQQIYGCNRHDVIRA
jgi:hypothetical protein